MSGFSRLSRAELETMAGCGSIVVECHSHLAHAGQTVLSQLWGGGSEPDSQHYPAGDVYDPATHAQYFYHAHAPAERDGHEHGHFHTFLRGRGMPPGLRPMVMPELAVAGNPAAPRGPLVPSAPQQAPGEDDGPWSHLVAISLGESGWPVQLFTTNRWVTGETWYTAADVAAMLDRFAVDGGRPATLLDRWITAMLGLFRPQIGELLQARDAAVMGWRRRRRGKVHVLEDRRLEITSRLEIDVEGQLRWIESALRQVA